MNVMKGSQLMMAIVTFVYIYIHNVHSLSRLINPILGLMKFSHFSTVPHLFDQFVIDLHEPYVGLNTERVQHGIKTINKVFRGFLSLSVSLWLFTFQFPVPFSLHHHCSLSALKLNH